MSAAAPTVLLVERPGAFRDALTSAIASTGASVETSDDPLDALSRLGAAPDVLLVADDAGPPGGVATCRIARRKLPQSRVYLLLEARSGAETDETSAALYRSAGVAALCSELTGNAPAPSSQDASPSPGSPPVAGVSAAPDVPDEPPLATPEAPPPSEPAKVVDEPKPKTTKKRASSAPPKPKQDERVAMVEALIDRGRWDEIAAMLGPAEAAADLPADLGLMYAIARKETATDEATSDIDALAIRSMSKLLGVRGDSPAALVLAKRTLRLPPSTLRSRSAEPGRTSTSLLFFILLLGGAIGLLLARTGLLPF